MSVYHQIFQRMDQPMLILREKDHEVQIEDANYAFLRLTGYTLAELRSRSTPHLLQNYNIDTTRQVLKSEVMLYTKLKRHLPVRIDQQPLPKEEDDDINRAFIVFEDLTSYKWIAEQAELNKVLISGIVDSHLHIRFLRDSVAPLLFEPDRTIEDETLMTFIADKEQEKLKLVLQEAYLLKKERSLTLQTSKLSGIELELSITFTPILDGNGEVKEFAFVIWDLRAIDDKIASSMKLKIWMAKRDVTAGHLSASTGISIQTISKLRNGKIEKPQRLTAELVASELQVDVHEIWPEIRK
ncbi:helix-turn-helix domain-containing protein [Paenibacillus alkaliterrae]|uniref:helix-turn-helix domain-containing protein n=1 Tax=Paenibacillus alkaliterrae TaxID=320909 RepID=UPI001F2B4C76|nr:helix-turn-helix domain-containing protein [Paenibacillus alkaliterrae]MCF2937464.1 helix-turn-helix domain-containing protein [Paenibacillus alkaliterrae]